MPLRSANTPASAIDHQRDGIDQGLLDEERRADSPPFSTLRHLRPPAVWPPPLPRAGRLAPALPLAADEHLDDQEKALR